MASPTEDLVAEAGEAFVASLSEQLRSAEQLGDVDPRELGSQAADWAAQAVQAVAGTSPVARRIGAVYSTDDLTRWLVAPGKDPLTGEAVRKRAKQRRLVAFRTDDGQWAFPGWQFTRAAGRLVPRTEVIKLWRRLPHGSFLTDADLAAWMNTTFDALEGTPAARAHAVGADEELLGETVSRLRARAA